MTAALALDLRTSTGRAPQTADGRITSGTESFRLGRFEGGGMRYLRFRRWLTETAIEVVDPPSVTESTQSGAIR